MPVFLEILVLIWIMDKDIHIQLYFACSKTNENCLIVSFQGGRGEAGRKGQAGQNGEKVRPCPGCSKSALNKPRYPLDNDVSGGHTCIVINLSNNPVQMI